MLDRYYVYETPWTSVWGFAVMDRTTGDEAGLFQSFDIAWNLCDLLNEKESPERDGR